MTRAILFLAFAALCEAQTTVNGGRDYKGILKTSGSVSAVDFRDAASTAPAKAGPLAARPSACTQGYIYFATDVAAGQNLYFCTATGTPGVWTQMSGGSANISASAGQPTGNCAPPTLYVDTTNQDLWFCGAQNAWKKSAGGAGSLVDLAAANTWTGYNNFANAQWRPPEATVANLPSAAASIGKVFMVTDAVTAGSCFLGGGSVRELCRAAATGYECVGGCGSVGSGGTTNTPYLSSLLPGPDLTRTISGATHGFGTAALLVAVYDDSSPREAVNAGWSVDPTSYDVSIKFATPQTNYYVVINGGVGPAGPAGVQGPAGPTGASGSGSGSVNPGGTITANRIATFADPTGSVIVDGTQHSMGAGYLSATKTAGAGGVTANLLCKIDATGNVVLPALGDGGILGVCVSSRAAAQTVEVATRGVITCVADNATAIGNLAITGTTTAGRCRDSGQLYAGGVALSTQVLGRILTTAAAGSLVSIELFGPGHYGAAVQVADGGTGLASYAKGDILTAPGGAVLTRLTVGNDGQALTADAASSGGVKWAGSNRRTCIIDNDSQSATPLTAAQITGRCEFPFAAHIVEVGVWGGAGTGTQTYTGSTAIQLTRLRPNGGASAVVLSGPLSTPGSGANSNMTCATATLSGTCTNGLPSSNSISLAGAASVGLNAGDTVYVSSAMPDGVQSWFTITITYTAD
jgi:hypothetical protein